MSDFTKIHTTVGLSAKIKKIKLKRASTILMTASKKKQLLDEANEVSEEVDNSIKSLAHDKFAIRKEKRLKTFADIKGELDSLILSIDQESKTEKLVSKTKEILKDKKYGHIGDVHEILKTAGVNVENIEENTEELDKTPSKNVLSDVLFTPEIDNEQLDKNNQKIYEYMVKSGNTDAADYVLDLITRPSITPESVKDVKSNTDEVKKLSAIQGEINSKLDDLLEEKQDTGVDLPKSKKDVAKGNVIKQVSGIEKVDQGPGIGGLLSAALAGLLPSLLPAAIMPALGKIVPKLLSNAVKATGIGKMLFGGKDKTDVKIKPDTPKKTPPVSEKISTPDKSNVKTTSGKPPKPKGKSILKMFKPFVKSIPILGTVTSAAFAAEAAYDGYNNAGEILNKDEKDLTTTDKIAAAAGSVANEISFGWFSKEKIANSIVDFVEEDEQPESTPEKQIVALHEEIIKLEERKENTRSIVQKNNIENKIYEKKNEIHELSKNLVHVPEVVKEKQIYNIENDYSSTINETKNYDRSMTVSAQPVNSNINNMMVSGLSAEVPSRPRELFP